MASRTSRSSLTVGLNRCIHDDKSIKDAVVPWVAAMTKPNCEAVAEENLRRQGFACYVPRFQQRYPNKKTQIRPLFPRYIFIYIERAWYCLRGTRGITHVIMGESGPQPIPANEIEKLRARQDKKGYINLEPRPKFLPGEALRAKEGPLAGCLMVYDGMSAHERVKVLVSILGRKVPAEIDEKVLVAA